MFLNLVTISIKNIFKLEQDVIEIRKKKNILFIYYFFVIVTNCIMTFCNKLFFVNLIIIYLFLLCENVDQWKANIDI